MANEEVRAQISSIKKEVKGAYDSKRAALVALSLYYAGLSLQAFRQFQSRGGFWENQTKTAYNTVFSDAIIAEDAVGFFLAHLVEYGVYLELANDRKNQALLPIVMRFYSRFVRDVEALYAT